MKVLLVNDDVFTPIGPGQPRIDFQNSVTPKLHDGCTGVPPGVGK